MIDWRTFLTTVSAAALVGIFSIAWMSYNELQKLSWNMPLAMNEITAIKNDMQTVKKDIDRIERTVRIRQEDDKVVRLIEKE